MGYMDTVDTAWLAGILEGEGYFGAQKSLRPSGNYSKRISVRLEMTDEDIISRVADITGIGNIGEYHRPGYRISYYWQVQSKTDASCIMRLIYPYMGKRRREQIERCMALIGLAI